MGKRRNNQNNQQNTDNQKDQRALKDVNAQKDEDKKWSSKRFFAGSFIIILGFAASVYIAFWKFHSLAGLGLMGIGILLTVLIGFWYFIKYNINRHRRSKKSNNYLIYISIFWFNGF